MQFRYDQYWVDGFGLPLYVGVLLAVLIVYVIDDVIKLIKNRNKRPEKIIQIIMCLGTACFMFCVTTIKLFTGTGVYLLFERSTQAVETQGYISEIQELKDWQFESKATQQYYGEDAAVQFLIDGEKYIAMAKGDLDVGDYVTVTYLPKSRYVLSIYEAPPPGDDLQIGGSAFIDPLGYAQG